MLAAVVAAPGHNSRFQVSETLVWCYECVLSCDAVFVAGSSSVGVTLQGCSLCLAQGVALCDHSWLHPCCFLCCPDALWALGWYLGGAATNKQLCSHAVDPWFVCFSSRVELRVFNACSMHSGRL